VGLVLIVSRSTWLALAAASMVLFVLQAVPSTLRSGAPRASAASLAMTAAWVVVPLAVLGGLAGATRGAIALPTGAEYAAGLREKLMDTCRADPTLPVCEN